MDIFRLRVILMTVVLNLILLKVEMQSVVLPMGRQA